MFGSAACESEDRYLEYMYIDIKLRSRGRRAIETRAHHENCIKDQAIYALHCSGRCRNP